MVSHAEERMWFHFLSVSRAFVFRSDNSVINTLKRPATAVHIANMITQTQVMIVHEKNDVCHHLPGIISLWPTF